MKSIIRLRIAFLITAFNDGIHKMMTMKNLIKYILILIMFSANGVAFVVEDTAIEALTTLPKSRNGTLLYGWKLFEWDEWKSRGYASAMQPSEFKALKNKRRLSVFEARSAFVVPLSDGKLDPSYLHRLQMIRDLDPQNTHRLVEGSP